MTKRVTAWLVWLLVAAFGAAGLRHYRIDNTLDDWAPHEAAVSAFRSYLVIGGRTARFDIPALAARLTALPEVAFCIHHQNLRTLGPWAAVSPEEFVLSRDGTYAGLFCFSQPTTGDAELTAAVRRALRTRFGAEADQLAVGGPALFHVALNQASQQMLPQIMVLILLVGGLMLWWISDRLSVALAAMAALVLSQVTLLGVIAWLRFPMDMALSIVPPLMLALGFSYATHRALRRRVVRKLILCLMTTVLGIGCFATSGLTPLRAFAGFGMLGLALAWLAVVMLVHPPADQAPSRPRPTRWLGALLRGAVAVTGHRPGLVVSVAALLTLAALVAAPALRFETDPLNYFPRDAKVVRDFAELNRRLTGMLPSQILISGDADPRRVLADTPGVRKIIDVTPLVTNNGRAYWCLADNNALPALVEHSRRWQAWADQAGVTIQWRGVAAQLSAVATTVRRVALLSLPFMALLAMMIVGVIVRRLDLALAGLWINLLPVFALILVVGVTRWPLGLPALLTGAIAIGMAIDDTVHMATGIRRGWRPARLLVSFWRPCVGSTLVTAACACLFALAPFKPTAQFGVLMAAAALTALAGDILVLAAIWRWVRAP